MSEVLTTATVCAELHVTESNLRHVLRRPGAPKPAQHPTARVFLWTRGDLERLKQYLADRQSASRDADEPREGGGA
jgi:hypothetical protein